MDRRPMHGVHGVSALAPSTPTTPRAQAEYGEDRGGVLQLRCGQILLPSSGISNDAARVRSSGSRLRLNPMMGRLSGSASEPWLLSPSQSSTLPECSRLPLAITARDTMPLLDVKTPRTLRGAVRKASRVLMNYPVFVATAPEMGIAYSRKQAAVLRPSSSSSHRPGSSASPQKTRAASEGRCKRVSFEDDAKELTEEERGPAFERSMKLLDSLYDLRRAGQEEGQDEEEGEAEPDETIMRATLMDLEDTEETVRKIEASLAAYAEPVTDFGGKRHATAVVSNRTLLVTRRKAELLHATEHRIQEIEGAFVRREDIIVDVVQDTRPAPPEMINIHKFLKAHIHSGPVDPVDENKTLFDMFVSKFGLCKDHRTILRLEALASETTDWWAHASLREAEGGVDAYAIQRLIDTTVSIAGNADHPALQQCRKLLAEMLARKVLQNALRGAEKDQALVNNSKSAQPISAREAADAINTEFRAAVTLGANSNHPAMEQAKMIAMDLAMEEKNRWGLKALQFAHEAKGRDEAAALACAPGVLPVGQAEDKAAQIDHAVSDALAKGALPTHEHIQKAEAIAAELREEDGLRKRLAAKEKRMAAKAARSKGAAPQ